jgi:uncharacterized protein
MSHVFETVIGAPIDDVLGYYTRPGALRRLSPPWVPVRVVQEPDSLEDGVAVLALPGPVRWRSRIRSADGLRAFVAESTSPAVRWRDRFRFTASSPDATTITNEVDTLVPNRLLRPMFEYRHRQLVGDLAAHRLAAELLLKGDHDPVLNVAITGSSGLVGEAVTALLETGGHRVIRLVRRAPAGSRELRWDPTHPDPGLFQDVDAVIHLAGSPVAGRFTERHKRAVRESRLGPTMQLAQALGSSGRPRVLVSASAIGYYGPDRGDEFLDEDDERGRGFLADLVADWEAATEPARAAGIRVVNLRTGIAQSPRGGTLRLLRPLFESGLGGPVAGGQQWVSWVDLDDLADVYYRAVVDDDIVGAVNAVAPNPVRNREYTAILAGVLRRPALLPVPALGLQVLFGNEGAREFALASQRINPKRLLATGHRFRHPSLEASLAHQLGRAR